MDITIKLVFWAGLLLILKHFLADGPFQTDYQYKNKGKWLHPGGLLHAGIHGVGTLLAVFLAFVIVSVAKPLWYITCFSILIALADFTVHYLIDLIKIKTTENFGWTELTDTGTGQNKKKCLVINSNKYFWAFMADQAAHFLTYIIIICVMLAVYLQTPGIYLDKI